MPTYFKGYLGDAKTRLDPYKLIGDHLAVGVKRDGDHFRVVIISGSNWGSFRGLYRSLVAIHGKCISLYVDRVTEYSTDLWIFWQNCPERGPGKKREVGSLTNPYRVYLERHTICSRRGRRSFWRKKREGRATAAQAIPCGKIKTLLTPWCTCKVRRTFDSYWRSLQKTHAIYYKWFIYFI